MNRHCFRRGTVALVSLALLGAAAASGAGASTPGGPGAARGHAPGRRPLDEQALATRGLSPHRLVVRFADVATTQAARKDAAHDLSAPAGVPVRFVRSTSGGEAVVDVPAGTDVEQVAHDLEASGAVASAEPDYIAVPMATTPNDPGYPQQWHYGPSSSYGLGLPTAWDVTRGSTAIVVAVLDTGYRPHADLAPRVISSGQYDMVTDLTMANDGDGRDTDATDPGDYCASDPTSTSSWHGTHVAGTIGAVTNNGVGVAGVDWRAKILPVRVLGCGGGTFSDIADGIRYAAGITVNGVTNPRPADVINMSIGGYTGAGCGSTMQNAINDATAAGSIIVVAAGNDGFPADAYSPAACANVITVGATTRSGDAAYYSNFGPELDVSAPGGETYRTGYSGPAPTGVLSTLNMGATTPGADAYAWYQGTSMATPHVTGAVSLLRSLKPDITAAGAASYLVATAHKFAPGSDCAWLDCGAGIVDAGAAVTRLRNDLLHLTGPNGAQKWALGSSHAITWGAIAPSSTVKIELLRKGLSPVTLVNAVAASKHTWTWKISKATGATTQALIRVTRTMPTGVTITDSSDKYFALTK